MPSFFLFIDLLFLSFLLLASLSPFFVVQEEHERHTLEEATESDDGKGENRFDLGECENKKVSILWLYIFISFEKENLEGTV